MTLESAGTLPRGHSQVRAAVDLWAIRVLAGLGTGLKVRTFQQLLLAAALGSVPLVALATAVAVSLPATLVTGDPIGSPDHAAFAAGCTALLVAALVYVTALDLLRQHFTAARYAVSRSPLRGLWVAADLGPVPVVLAERGVLVTWRAVLQGGALGSAALYLHRAGNATAADVAAIAVLLPVATVAGGLALSLVDATARPDTDRRGVATMATGVVALVLVSLSTGWLLAHSVAGVLPPGEARERLRDSGRLSAAVAGLGGELGWLRMLVVVATVVALAALAVALARSDPWDPTVRTTPPRGPALGREGSRAGAGVLLAAVGGASRLRLGLRLLAALVAVVAVLAGWRLAGGPAVPVGARLPVTRALVAGAAGSGMIVASASLLLLGQTRLLWQLRVLWEAGLPGPRLHRMTQAPAYALAAVAVVLLAAVAVLAGLGRAVPAVVLVLACAVLSEQLVDSVFAGPGADDSARAGNTVLAIVSYLMLLPPVLVGFASSWWSVPVLGFLVVVIYLGGLSCFVRRLRSLPIQSVA